LALSPNDGETFLREVDEELRRERVTKFFTRYGWWVLAGVVLLLGAVAGAIWWQAHRAEAVGAEGETLVDALSSIEAGNRAAAAPKIAQLSQSRVTGYRAAALFTRANTETAAGNTPAAIATLHAISQDQDLDEMYRQAALIRQTMLEFDTLPPRAVIQRLAPLARAGSPWLGSAGEMVGAAHLKMHRPDLAGPVFAAIARDERAPDTVRARSLQMAGSLGIDVTSLLNARASGTQPTPAQPSPAAPAPPASTAPAAPAAPAN
jgi:hypothetical protein